MQVTKETWRMREQCVPGSLSSSPAQEPGNEASLVATHELVRAGHKVTILEMQGRVGGRVKTLSGDGGDKKTHKQEGKFAEGLYVDGKYLRKNM